MRKLKHFNGGYLYPIFLRLSETKVLGICNTDVIVFSVRLERRCNILFRDFKISVILLETDVSVLSRTFNGM
jgi:hypothetical protein